MDNTILHVDLDAFFASVEQRDNPALRGKPVLVGGSQGRGVVAAASYEARKWGVFSAMPMAEALRKCPDAIVVEHHMARYLDASKKFFGILADFSPLVQSVSVDEAFVDITGVQKLLGPPLAIAHSIKQRVREELSLVASVGVAPTKFVAKIASDIDKPDGLRMVEAEDVLAFLHPLPVSRLWGVGKVGREKLAKLGLHTVGELAAFPPAILANQLGTSLGKHLSDLAAGRDPRSVETGREAISIGHEQTFESDQGNPAAIAIALFPLAEKVAQRLRRRQLQARTVVLKIKFANFRMITRRRTLQAPSSDGKVLADTATELLGEVDIHNRDKSHRVRLCGVSAVNLVDRNAPRQLGFFEEQRQKGEVLGDVLDSINNRFGDAMIWRKK